MVTEDDIFIALGRAEGIANGFQTKGSNIQTGVEADGVVCGVMGQSATPLIGTPELPIDRVGVIGRVDHFGVYGMTDNAGPNSGFNGEPRFAGVSGTSDTEFGVAGTSNISSGVFGQAGDAAAPFGAAGVCGSSRQHFGVLGASSENVAVRGEAQSSLGVYGRSAQSTGVRGDSAGAGPVFGGGNAGVLGTSVTSPGVVGTSTKSWGVVGQSGAAAPSTFDAAVFGTSTAAIGVAGTSANTVGVLGTSTNNYGVIAMSGQAGPTWVCRSRPLRQYSQRRPKVPGSVRRQGIPTASPVFPQRYRHPIRRLRRFLPAFTANAQMARSAFWASQRAPQRAPVRVLQEYMHGQRLWGVWIQS